jgi:hypothetical protein
MVNKHSKRNEPSKSATLFKLKTIKKGNDGKQWIITKTKKNVKRWKRLTINKKNKKTQKKRLTSDRWKCIKQDREAEFMHMSTTKTYISVDKMKKKTIGKTKLKHVYFVHDNGGRPFKVEIFHNELKCYEHSPLDNYSEIPSYDMMKYKINKFEGYWSGFDSSPYKMHGNSLLIKINKNKYVHIGSKIYQFTTNDKILDYVSPVGNSNVPYPIAYGEDNVYFMLDRKYIKNDDIPLEKNIVNAEDMYSFYYQHQGPVKKEKYHIMKSKILVEQSI